MQRPPSGKGLPLAPASPIHDAIRRITAKQADLAALKLSPAQQTSLSKFVERAFTESALALARLDVSEDQIALVQNELDLQSSMTGHEPGILKTLASMRILQSVADRGRAEPLTPDLLLRIHDPYRPPASAEVQADPSSRGESSTERAMPRIRAFCDWVSADSFRELNPLEQAGIVILRLLEIRPFEEGNVAAALGAGSLFTMRAGWPPIIIPGPLRPRFNPAVAEGLKMNTRPMVDLLAESIGQTLDSMINFGKAQVDRS
jgi:hypothetical protein